jgi:hypothetical protein
MKKLGLFLILSVLAFGSAARAADQTVAVSTYEYPVTSSYLGCTKDTDCTVVGTSCNGCCQQGAVAKNFQKYDKNDREFYCKAYKGAVCECIAAKVHAVCQEKKCVLQPGEPKAGPDKKQPDEKAKPTTQSAPAAPAAAKESSVKKAP